VIVTFDLYSYLHEIEGNDPKRINDYQVSGAEAFIAPGDGPTRMRIVEINCETDFVARNEDFQQFTRDVSLQIAAMAPQFVHSDEVGEDVISKERAVLLAKALESGKTETVVQKMVDGQISKWKKEICLLDQPFVKDGDKTINDLQQSLIAKIGENIKIRRFVRFELGEGLDKKKNDFAAEVAQQAGLA